MLFVNASGPLRKPTDALRLPKRHAYQGRCHPVEATD